MKKKVYRVRTQYIFEGVFEVVAESREDAQQKVLFSALGHPKNFQLQF